MPRMSKEVAGGEMPDTVETIAANLVITTEPVLICGVNRKVNTGNYENVDVYGAIAIPMAGTSLEDKEYLRSVAEAVAELGFGIVSEETGARYQLLKDMQRSGRR